MSKASELLDSMNEATKVDDSPSSVQVKQDFKNIVFAIEKVKMKTVEGKIVAKVIDNLLRKVSVGSKEGALALGKSIDKAVTRDNDSGKFL